MQHASPVKIDYLVTNSQRKTGDGDIGIYLDSQVLPRCIPIRPIRESLFKLSRLDLKLTSCKQFRKYNLVLNRLHGHRALCV
eukprot:122051-Amphidinium_carterae.1